MNGAMELLRAAQEGDRDACEQAVLENNGLIWSVVRRYYGRGVEPDDLYQLGCLGFLKAIRGFDFSYGTCFSTYAVPKIAGEIRRFLRDDGTIKVGRSIREQALTLYALRERLRQELGREPSLSELSAQTGWTPEEIAQVDLATEAFRRMGYKAQFVTIDWVDKKELVENGTVDCLWGSFSIDGREDEYRWAGPYMVSRQVVAVMPGSDIETLADLAGKTVAVQATTKPEVLFLGGGDPRIPEIRALLSMQKRELIYAYLSKGYADAVAAHETSILQFMSDFGIEYRILDEPLQVVGLGVAFALNDDRGLDTALNAALADMRTDGTTRAILAKYLPDPDKYLEVDYGR